MLASQLEPYRLRYQQARWTRPASWHLTLLFLGSVDPGRVPDLRALVDLVAAQAAPYRIRADAGGGRARGDDGVAWIGLSEGAGRLIGLAADIATRCPPGVTQGAPPKRTPAAHLTVARRADHAVVRALREQRNGPLGVSWTVDRLALVRSHTEPAGARYETLHEAAL